jgi:hypothetical protein
MGTQGFCAIKYAMDSEMDARIILAKGIKICFGNILFFRRSVGKHALDGFDVS